MTLDRPRLLASMIFLDFFLRRSNVIYLRLSFTELVGSGTRPVRGTNVHRQSDHEDNAEGAETVEMREGGSVTRGRIERQHQILQVVRFEFAQERDEQREKVRFLYSLYIPVFKLRGHANGVHHSLGF